MKGNWNFSMPSVEAKHLPFEAHSHLSVNGGLLDTRFWSYLLLFLLVCLPTAAQAFVRVEKVEVGLDGYARGERWVPVVFQLKSYGENFQGSLEVFKGETGFKKSLDLSSGAGKQVEILVYFSNYYENLHYELINKQGRKIQEGRLDVRTLNYTDNLVLVIAGGEYNHQFLNGEQNPWGGKTFVAYHKPEQLYSEWMAYSAADAIALGPISTTSLLPAQWKALLQAVASGKPLICSAGTGFSALSDPLLRDHLPAISAQMTLTSNAGFLASRWAGLPEVSIPAQSVQPRIWDEGLAPLDAGHSLITSSTYYKGNIIYFAFDYTRLPEVLRSHFAGFWNETVFPSSGSPPSFVQPFRKLLQENARVQKNLYDIPGLQVPEAKWFALFFFLYVFALGPLQYLALRFLKQRSLLWITFPAIILLFSVASFGYSRFRHTSHDLINQIAVIELFPELDHQVTFQVYGMTMSDTGTFDFVAVPSNSYLRKFSIDSSSYQPEPFTLSEDLPHALLGETMKNWTFRTFESVGTDSTATKLTVSIRLDGDVITGTVRNASALTFTKSLFYYDFRNSIDLGELGAGKNRSFLLKLNSKSPVVVAEPQLRDLLDLYSVSYGSPHFFFGETAPGQGKLVINGQTRDTKLNRYVAAYADIAKNDGGEPR